MAYKLQKQTLRKMFGSRCMLCERPLQKKKCTAHHQIPLSCKGDTTLDNLAIVCAECSQIIHRFEYGSEAYTKLNNVINKNKVKYDKRR